MSFDSIALLAIGTVCTVYAAAIITSMLIDIMDDDDARN